jgi:hypothetical protein
MTSIQFDSRDVVCNGNVGGVDNILTDDNKSILKTFLMTHFMMTPKKIILQELEDSSLIDGRWFIGRRADDNNEIISRMASGLLNYATPKFDNNRELAEMWINAQVKMFTAKDIITIAESALHDCASADHWYTYEKEW